MVVLLSILLFRVFAVSAELEECPKKEVEITEACIYLPKVNNSCGDVFKEKSLRGFKQLRVNRLVRGCLDNYKLYLKAQNIIKSYDKSIKGQNEAISSYMAKHLNTNNTLNQINATHISRGLYMASIHFERTFLDTVAEVAYFTNKQVRELHLAIKEADIFHMLEMRRINHLNRALIAEKNESLKDRINNMISCAEGEKIKIEEYIMRIKMIYL
jgi:hypothetical protein